MHKSTIPADYRGRDQMSLVEFIEDVEACHFRTGHDTGANLNAMMIWNIVREWAGMESLDHDDLIQRHADSLGWTFEEMKDDYAKLDVFLREQRARYNS